MMNKYKIFFVGLNNETLILLSRSNSIEIVGASYFYYFEDFSFNPIDLFFKFTYKLHFKKKSRNLVLILLKTWNIFSGISSTLFKNNKEYLNLVIKKNINLIDVEDEKYFADFLREKETDLLVINSWGILPNDVLKIPKYKTLNIHPSLLPQYRGALPTLWSLKNNDKESGLTYLILNDFIDDGIIISQYHFEIDSEDDWYSLELKCAEILERTLVNDVLKYLKHEYEEIQPPKEVSFTGFYGKYRKLDLINESSKDIYNKVGLYPFLEPFFYCYIEILGRRINIKKINYVKRKNMDRKIVPGQIKVIFSSVFFYTKDDILKSYLFSDINFLDSLFLLFNKITNKI